MDSSIHNVKEVKVTSRELKEGLGMTTRITVSSQPSWSDDVTTEDIILFKISKPYEEVKFSAGLALKSALKLITETSSN